MAQQGIGGFDSAKYRDTITPTTQSKPDTDMSFSSLTDNQGNRYLLSLGHRLQPTDAIGFQQAVQALGRIDAAQLFAAEREIFHFHNTDLYQQLERRLGKNWRSARETELNLHSPVGAFPGRWAIILDAIYHGDLRFTKVATHKEKQPTSPAKDNRGILRVKIRQALAAIVVQEKAEAARHSTLLSGETPTNRAFIYGGAFLTGLWNAGTDFAQWLKEVNDVTNPLQRSLRGIHSSFRALQRNSETGEDLLAVLEDEVLAAEKRELVQVLGFDPTAITRAQFHRATEMADLIWEDPALQADIRQFVKDYVKAQHPIEITEFSGAAAFEVLFTILLAAVTAGTGLAASAAGQARHFAKFGKVGDLLMEFAEQAKRVRQRLQRNASKSNNGSGLSFNDLSAELVTVAKELAPQTVKPAIKSKSSKPSSSNKTKTPKRERPKPDNWETYQTHGIDRPPLESEVGKAMVESLESQGLTRQQAVMKAQEYIVSGVDLPRPVNVNKGDKLCKLVPEGEFPGKCSAYFVDKAEIDRMYGIGYDDITDKIGIPLESQQTEKFNLFEVEAIENSTVFQSTIAPTTQNGYSQPGGGKQTLILNRSLFSEPKNTGRKFP